MVWYKLVQFSWYMSVRFSPVCHSLFVDTVYGLVQVGTCRYGLVQFVTVYLLIQYMVWYKLVQFSWYRTQVGTMRQMLYIITLIYMTRKPRGLSNGL